MDILFCVFYLLEEEIVPSAPMETSLTPLLAMKSRALLTLAILWKRILPRSGLGRVSPEITSSKSISFRPLRKSSSMFSMPVPALRRWELHQAVKVCKQTHKLVSCKIIYTCNLHFCMSLLFYLLYTIAVLCKLYKLFKFKTRKPILSN